MNKYVATIPMQNSILQTTTFILFMLSLFCLNSMLPCGRYYYEPGGAAATSVTHELNFHCSIRTYTFAGYYSALTCWIPIFSI